MKIKACRQCERQPKLKTIRGKYAEDIYYTYECKCKATPLEFDGTRQEAIERWNEECGK